MSTTRTASASTHPAVGYLRLATIDVPGSSTSSTLAAWGGAACSAGQRRRRDLRQGGAGWHCCALLDSLLHLQGHGRVALGHVLRQQRSTGPVRHLRLLPLHVLPPSTATLCADPSAALAGQPPPPSCSPSPPAPPPSSSPSLSTCPPPLLSCPCLHPPPPAIALAATPRPLPSLPPLPRPPSLPNAL